MDKPIFLHAGAHRTGTSSFQLCLAQNRHALEGGGFDLAYPGRDGIPDANLRLRMPRGNVGAHRLPEFAAGMRSHLSNLSPDGARGLILSEENIPGPMRHFYEGGFYPFASNRLQALAQALPTRPAHLIYVLRSYDELFVSAYRKRAEDNAVPPFRDLVPVFTGFTGGWPLIVTLLREILQPDRLTVLTHAPGRSSLDLLHTLVPETADLPLQPPDRVVNRSATDAALIALQARYRDGETLVREEWQSVISSHSHRPEPGGFACFPDAERRILRDRYAADLDLVAGLPGIHFLR